MSDTDINKCSICLTTSKDANIIDSSSFTQFFIQDLGLKDFNKKMWLCVWCKSSMKKAIGVMTLALQSDKTSNDEGESIDIENTKINNIALHHCPPMDIPPEEKSNDEDADDENETVNSQYAHLTEEQKREIARLRSQRQIDYEGLNYEVIELSLEEQMKDMDVFRERFKDYDIICEQCGVGMYDTQQLAEHMKRHVKFCGDYGCEICGVRFISKDIYTRHALAHKRRFKCKICLNVFKRWTYCVSHRFKCGGVVCPIACPECPKILSDSLSLRVHLKIHRADKRYRCEHCDRVFSSKQRLLVHLRTHSGEKPFLCEHCGRGFSTRSIMRAHLSVHSDVSPYYCVECDAYYKTSKGLKRHFKESAKHSSDRADLYPCRYCTRRFVNEDAMKNHSDTHSENDNRCEQCDKVWQWCGTCPEHPEGSDVDQEGSDEFL